MLFEEVIVFYFEILTNRMYTEWQNTDFSYCYIHLSLGNAVLRSVATIRRSMTP